MSTTTTSADGSAARPLGPAASVATVPFQSTPLHHAARPSRWVAAVATSVVLLFAADAGLAQRRPGPPALPRGGSRPTFGGGSMRPQRPAGAPTTAPGGAPTTLPTGLPTASPSGTPAGNGQRPAPGVQGQQTARPNANPQAAGAPGSQPSRTSADAAASQQRQRPDSVTDQQARQQPTTGTGTEGRQRPTSASQSSPSTASSTRPSSTASTQQKTSSTSATQQKTSSTSATQQKSSATSSTQQRSSASTSSSSSRELETAEVGDTTVVKGENGWVAANDNGVAGGNYQGDGGAVNRDGEGVRWDDGNGVETRNWDDDDWDDVVVVDDDDIDIDVNVDDDDDDVWQVAAGVVLGATVRSATQEQPAQSTTVIVSGTTSTDAVGASYQPVPAPVGAVVATLPDNCAPVSLSGVTYQYCAGVWYARATSGWQVVPPPQ